MDVTLLHNPSSGDENHSAERIVARVEEAGHRVAYWSVEEDGWEQALDERTDLVVAAGGDGTVGDVMKLLAGRPVPLTILPSGTANNIAASLGLAGRSFAELVAGWLQARHVRYVLGELTAGGETTRFVEAVGGGIVAAAVERAQELERQGTSSELGIRALRRLVDELPVERWEVEADGDDAGGEFLAVDVMIVGPTGPSLPFAPGADPADGLFDLVTVGAADRGALARYLDSRLAGSEAPLPLQVRRAAEVRLSPPRGVPLRLDDAPWTPAARELAARPGPSVGVWLP